ncbi:hypothetical protein WICPIJ_002454, partial [Wickerhamomyces pijperi]
FLQLIAVYPIMRLLKVLVSDPSVVKSIKTQLESSGKLNKALKIGKEQNQELNTTVLTLPTLFLEHEQNELNSTLSTHNESQFTTSAYEYIQQLNDGPESEPIFQYLSSIIPDSNPLKQTLLANSPKKYTIYPPMLLINNHNTFDSPEWTQYLSTINATEFFNDLLTQCFNASNLTHIALNKPIIEQDILRRPFNIIPLHGDFGPEPTDQMYDTPTEKDFQEAFWCGVVQNGIKQVWAPRYTMFSRGNIKEKARILNTFKNVKERCVIDMYAGIGYFTLSYLKLGAKNLYCFELNPWSIKGLMLGCEANKIKYKMVRRGEKVETAGNDVRCFIFQESNEHVLERLQELRELGLTMDITHFNLGLLPSSKQSWEHTINAFIQFSNEKCCDVHVHENVSVADLPEFMSLTKAELTELGQGIVSVKDLHLEKIKTFAPDVWHICADFRVMKKV